jgi:hypothetical protein
VGEVVAQLAVGAIDPRAEKGVDRHRRDALRREVLHERKRVVLRALEQLGVEIAEKPYRLRVP